MFAKKTKNKRYIYSRRSIKKKKTARRVVLYKILLLLYVTFNIL